MTTEALALLMFLSLAVVLMLGFPVAFSLAAVASVFAVFGVAAGHFDAAFLLAMPLRIQGVFHNDNFLAIPLFVLMGMLLKQTGIAEQMLLALETLFGRMRGGLAYAAIIVGAAFSAITGFVSAAVITMGLISLPVMLRAGYDHRLATGVTAAAGTLAQVLPPSLVLIVLAEQLEVSLIEIYRAALVPSAILIASYIAYVFALTRLRPNHAPPAALRIDDPSPLRMWSEVARAAGIPLALLLAVLSAIYLGIATPSEGGAIGVIAVLLLSAATRQLRRSHLREAVDTTGILCSSVIFLLLGASFFTLVFRGLNGHELVESWFRHVPAGQLGFLVFINVAVFLLAFFLDFFEIAFIVLPLIAPIARKYGVDMVWLTVVLAVNLQTSFMHPPFGIALYNLRSVAPATVKTSQIYWGAVPFLAIQLFVVALLIAFPEIVSTSAQPTLREMDDVDMELVLPKGPEYPNTDADPPPPEVTSSPVTQ